MVGRKVNCLTVKRLRTKPGRWGPISTGEYDVECECGETIKANYHQIYYATIYSCGCTVRPKHPPIRLENQTIGQLRVMRWADEQPGGAWECVCQECGGILYFKKAKELREASGSCEAHGLVPID